MTHVWLSTDSLSTFNSLFIAHNPLLKQAALTNVGNSTIEEQLSFLPQYAIYYFLILQNITMQRALLVNLRRQTLCSDY